MTVAARLDRLDSKGGGVAILVAPSVRAEELAVDQSHDEHGVLRVECCGIRVAGTAPPLEINAMYRPPWGATADQVTFFDAATARAMRRRGEAMPGWPRLTRTHRRRTRSKRAADESGDDRWSSAPESAPFAAHRGAALTTVTSGSIADCPTAGSEMTHGTRLWCSQHLRHGGGAVKHDRERRHSDRQGVARSPRNHRGDFPAWSRRRFARERRRASAAGRARAAIPLATGQIRQGRRRGVGEVPRGGRSGAAAAVGGRSMGGGGGEGGRGWGQEWGRECRPRGVVERRKL